MGNKEKWWLVSASKNFHSPDAFWYTKTKWFFIYECKINVVYFYFEDKAIRFYFLFILAMNIMNSYGTSI